MGTISENFSFHEFEYTDYKDLKYANIIRDWDVRNNIVGLVTSIVQPLRTAWEKPLKITSGYRCPELNKRVGGSSTSAHLKGLACDIRPAGNPTQEQRKLFIRWAINWIVSSGIPFDQLIDEHDRKGNYWLHIGFKNLKGEQRGEVKLNFEKKP